MRRGLEPELIDAICSECEQQGIEQDMYSDDFCEKHFLFALEWDKADDAVKYAKENHE